MRACTCLARVSYALSTAPHTNTNTFVLLMTKSQFKALGSLIEYKKTQKVIASELKTRIDLHDRRHIAPREEGACSQEQLLPEQDPALYIPTCKWHVLLQIENRNTISII